LAYSGTSLVPPVSPAASLSYLYPALRAYLFIRLPLKKTRRNLLLAIGPPQAGLFPTVRNRLKTGGIAFLALDGANELGFF
jgi:hypothetical protein